MSDILGKLSKSAHKRVRKGYYDIATRGNRTTDSFRRRIKTHTTEPVIGEIKPGSPTQGKLFEGEFDPEKLGRSYSNGGVIGFSVLTDSDHFFGSLDNLRRVSKLGKPVLMKDFVVDYTQIDAGKTLGADAMLMIYRLFTRGIPNFKLSEGINHAHQLDMEVLLETNDRGEYEAALQTDADMIGINNRDLRSLKVDLSTTQTILANSSKDRIVWSLSGISSRSDVDYLKRAGADAFLVGTSLAKANNRESFIQTLTGGSDG
ncbi:MAG: indole-3-glycerol-phosphate synthase [Candidatus Bipolaricaulia bacterium]